MSTEVLATWPPGTFTAQPLIRKIATRRWRLEEPLGYRSRAGRVFIVRAGFVTDGASVPRVAWWLYPPLGGAYDRAAVVHDDLYAHAELFGGYVFGDDEHGHISRADVDRLFLEMMAVDGFRPTGRAVVYSAVRIGGWLAWRRYRRAAAAAAEEE